MSEDQLKVEVDWCLARLEEKLAAMDPYSRPGPSDIYIYVSIIIKFECHVNGSDEVYIYLLGIISVPVP